MSETGANLIPVEGSKKQTLVNELKDEHSSGKFRHKGKVINQFNRDETPLWHPTAITLKSVQRECLKNCN